MLRRPLTRLANVLRAHSGMIRSLAILAVGLIAVGAVLPFLDRFQPLGTWLAIPLGVILAWQVVLNLAWAGAGLLVTRRLLPVGLPPIERLCIGVAVGVTGFAFALYLLGALHLFRPAFAVGLVIVFLATGLPGLRRWWHESATDTFAALPKGWLGTAVVVFGIFGIGIAYLGVLTPDAINYDSRWMHLASAQDYAREGRLLAFSGDWQRMYPQLGSMLHTWDFLVPGLSEPLTRWMMALHTEFSLFLWTLVGVGCAARWLAAEARVRGAWAAFFLFPGIFVYDGNMGGAQDHIAASFILPLFMLCVRLPAQRSDTAFALWGIVGAGALLSKFQTVYFVGPMILLLLWRLVRAGESFRFAWRRILRVAAIILATVVVVTAPHFVKNTVFHHNPVYPLAQDWFTGSRPTVPDAPLLVRYLLTDWNCKPSGDVWHRLAQAAELIFTFAFKPHYAFMGNLPTFGFLFTLTLPLLLFVNGARRLWVGAIVSLMALFCWASTYLVDRNLQIILPLLVATTAAILVRAWAVGWLARLGVVALVALQIVWGGDLWFAGSDRMMNSISLIRSSLDGRGKSRFAGMSADYFALDRALPKDAVVLLHHWHPQLGINRQTYLDWAGFQGVVDYREFKNVRDFYDRLRALGVTHVVYLPGEQAASSKQEDVILLSLALGYGQPRTRFGMFEMFPLPAIAPPARPPLQVVTIGLGTYGDGLYDVSDLGTCRFLPAAYQHYPAPRLRPGAAGFAPLLGSADAVLRGAGVTMDPSTKAMLAKDFQMAVPYPGLSVYIRKK
jgi:hypothetical protein